MFKPSRAEILSVLDYRSDAGELWWRSDTSLVNLRLRGKRAGCLRPDGYWTIGIFGHCKMEHLLIWTIETGEWPDFEIDHRDTVRHNNQFVNLRPATRAQQQCNRGKQVNNKSGHKGVYWDSHRGRWHVHVRYMGHQRFVGRFDDVEAAARAYQQAVVEMHGEFARLD
jgi:hypothetical protein